MRVDFNPYKGKDVSQKVFVFIKGRHYWLTENKDAESRELLGRYNVNCLGWGNSYCDWSSFSEEEKSLLKTTVMQSE